MIVLPFDKSKDSIFCKREDKDSETVILLWGGKIVEFLSYRKICFIIKHTMVNSEW